MKKDIKFEEALEKLAEIKGISVDEMAQTVAENARKLFFDGILNLMK